MSRFVKKDLLLNIFIEHFDHFHKGNGTSEQLFLESVYNINFSNLQIQSIIDRFSTALVLHSGSNAKRAKRFRQFQMNFSVMLCMKNNALQHPF